MAERVMRVQGWGEASAAPDRVVLRFELSAPGREYGAAVQALNQSVEHLRGDLEAEEITREQLKTTSFRVSPTYEKISRLGREHRELSGYVASHTIHLKLPMVRELLNRVLTAVAESSSEPTVSIGFEVSDPAPMRQQSLKNAVADALRNAETLAEASGVSLVQVRSIEYGWAEMRIRSLQYDLSAAPVAQAAAAPDIEPEEVKASESVTVTWEIE